MQDGCYQKKKNPEDKPTWPATGAGRSFRKDGNPIPTMPATLRLPHVSILVSLSVPCLCSCSNFHGRTSKHGYWQGELFSSSAFFRGLGVLAFPLVFPLTKHGPKKPSSFPVLPASPSFPSPFLKHNSCPGLFSPCFSHLPVTTTVFLMEPVLPVCRFPWLYFIHRTKTTFLVLTFYI